MPTNSKVKTRYIASQQNMSNEPQGKIKIWALVLIVGVVSLVILSVVGIGLYFYAQTATRTASETNFNTLSYGSTASAVGSTDSYLLKTAVPSALETTGSELNTPEVLPQKIIKTASVSLSVTTAEKALANITTLASNYQGFIQSSRTYETANERTAGEITLRIPVADFTTALEAIKKEAKVVLSESITGQDVTEEYLDLEARLKNKQAEENQYTQILTKAVTIEDILKVTRVLEETRAEVEALQGQIKYLADKTDLATITVSLTEETNIIATTKTWEPLENIRQAFQTWIIFLQTAADGLVWLLIFLLPPALVIYLIVRIIIYTYRRKHNKVS